MLEMDTRSSDPSLVIFQASPQQPREPPGPLTADYIQLALLTILFVIGAPINLVSFSKLWRRKTLRSTGRLAILKLHLNVADLMILFIYVTSTACWQITFQWRGGDILCKVIKFLHSTSFQLSSNIMVAVALDRLVTIVHCNFGRRSSQHHHRRRSTRRSFRGRRSDEHAACALRYVRIFVYTAWTSAILLNLPQFAIWRVYAPFEDRPDWRQCVTVWAIPRDRSNQQSNGWNGTIDGNEEESTTLINQFTYDVLQLVFVFWTPAVLLIVSYLVIVLYLQRLCVKERKMSIGGGRRRRSAETVLSSGQRISGGTLIDGEKTRKRLSSAGDEDAKPIEKKHGTNSEDQHRHQEQPSGHRRPSRDLRTRKKPSTDSHPHAADESLSQNRKDSHDVASGTEPSGGGGAITVPAGIQLVRKKTFRTSMMLIVAYLLFWLPYNSMALWYFLDTQGYRKYAFSLKFLNVLIVLNSVVNPFIYGTLGRRWVCV